ncbi:MAG TPA: glycosyltransferase [Candidatus Acidoferrum sp.]|nr:glycosyltransferase [Candidatus Acidoferrum sp.]
MLFQKREAQRDRRVLVHGLYYCGRMFADFMKGDGWDVHYYPDGGIGNFAAMAGRLAACDLVYQIGGRLRSGKFLQAAKLLKKEKIVMHWAGSDALDEQKNMGRKTVEPWILHNVRHWAVSEWMVREVQALGVSCELVTIPSSYVPEGPSPLPSEFSVLVYMPNVGRGSLYGLDQILRVAQELPHVPFELVGLLEGRIQNPPSNLRIHGRIPNLQEFYKRAAVLWRPTRHDGMPSMVFEALGHGRHVLWTYPFPGCVQVACAAEAQAAISQLHALHQEGRLEVNSTGARVIADGYLPGTVKDQVLRRFAAILEART